MRECRWVRWEEHDLILRLQVQPRAARDGFAGVYSDRLRVRIAAAPVAGAANNRLIAFLAKQFGVPKKQVVLVHGQSGKTKVVRITAPRVVPEILDGIERGLK